MTMDSLQNSIMVSTSYLLLKLTLQSESISNITQKHRNLSILQLIVQM